MGGVLNLIGLITFIIGFLGASFIVIKSAFVVSMLLGFGCVALFGLVLGLLAANID